MRPGPPPPSGGVGAEHPASHGSRWLYTQGPSHTPLVHAHLPQLEGTQDAGGLWMRPPGGALLTRSCSVKAISCFCRASTSAVSMADES